MNVRAAMFITALHKIWRYCTIRRHFNEFVVLPTCRPSVFSTKWQCSEPVVFSNPDQMLWIDRQLAAVYKILHLKCETLVLFFGKQQNKLKLNCAVKANIILVISPVLVSTQTHTTLVLSIYSRLHVSALMVSHHQWQPEHVVVWLI